MFGYYEVLEMGEVEMPKKCEFLQGMWIYLPTPT